MLSDSLEFINSAKRTKFRTLKMALNSSCFLLIVFLCCLYIFSATATEFLVGGDDGWAAPEDKNNDQVYNHWASKYRFKTGDTLRFKYWYKKDSVSEVSAEEYDKCQSRTPSIVSSKLGEVIFKLKRPGLYYFSSNNNNCEKGVKMIIKVMDPETKGPAPSHEYQSTADKKNAAFFSSSLLVTVSLGFLFI